MGISGLLPLLKEIQVNGHVSDFKGKRLAVDAYVWLHKAAFGCAEDIVKGKKTVKFVEYAMHRVRLLRHHGVEPYIVFDGGPLPAKKGTEVSRAKSRAEGLARAQALEGQGRHKEARDSYAKCLDITPELAYQFIKALRAEKVAYVVAPYEADAQLCFLEREGYVDGIITEDSDLLVFGCNQVVFKMDSNGQCVSIERCKLAGISEFPMDGWTDVQFRRMAMLSGCDYLDSIPGIGLKTAHRLMRRLKTVERIIQSIRLEGALLVPDTYTSDFAQAELAFLYQRVYDPALQKLVPLNDFPERGLQAEDEKWVGLDKEIHIAQGIANGDLHPETGERIEDVWPDYTPGNGSHNTAKVVLGSSSKQDVISGPMDAFVKRNKLPRATLPTPVGVLGSGAKRLSDMPTSSRRVSLRTASNDELVPIATTKSKFFGKRKTWGALDESAVPELKWEESDEELQDIDIQPGPSHRSPSRPAGSSSPVLSDSWGKTQSPPPHLANDQLTSPMAPPSSPALSTPPHSSRSVAFSPTPPISPSDNKLHVLVDPSSPPAMLSQTFSVVSMIAQTPSQELNPSRALFRKSEKKPDSSPVFGPSHLQALCRIPMSSDSIEEEEDEVVTPAAEAKPVLTAKRKRMPEKEVEIDDDERERIEKARIVSEGWKAKYGFPGMKSTPISMKRMSAHTPKITPQAAKQTPMPSERVLFPRPVNALRTPMTDTTTPTRTVCQPVHTPFLKQAVPPAEKATLEGARGLTWSSLEKFRFKRKVTE